MAHLLMPMATAVWLVENTALTFDQVAGLCELHPLEVQGIADGEVAIGITGLDPIANGQLTRGEIAACEADPSRKLTLAESAMPAPKVRAKGPRYTPVAKRHDRPNAIAWLLRYHPELTDGQVSKLVGTTKPTINAIRERTHWNISNLKLEDPVSLGMCSQIELDQAVSKAAARQRARDQREAREARKAEAAANPSAAPSAEALPAPPVAKTAEELAEEEKAAPTPIWSTAEQAASRAPADSDSPAPRQPAAREDSTRSIEPDQVFTTPSGPASEPAPEEEELDPEKIFARPDTPEPAAPAAPTEPTSAEHSEGEAHSEGDSVAVAADEPTKPPTDPQP